MSYLTPHIALYDTTTQAIAVANTPQLVTFDTNLLSKKIAYTSTSRFTANEAGDYLVAFTAHVTASTANKTLDIWVRVNGTDVTGSNSKTTIINNEIQLVSAVITVPLTAGQYVELWMSGDATTLSLIGYAVGATPTRPLTPSIRMTVDRLP